MIAFFRRVGLFLAFFSLVIIASFLISGFSLNGPEWAITALNASSRQIFAETNASRPTSLVEVRPAFRPVTDLDEDILLEQDRNSPKREIQSINDNPAPLPTPPPSSPPPSLGKLALGPGITYFQTKRNYASGPAVYNVLEIADISDSRIGLKVSLPGDKVQNREGVSGHMNRNGPNIVAGINGDFFDIGKAYSGVTINASMQNGELTRTNEGNRPAFGIGKDGLPIIGVPRTNASLTVGQRSWPIYHINYTPGENLDQRRDWLVMWTPAFGPGTATGNDPATLTVVIRNLRTSLPLKPNTNYTGSVESLIEGGGNTAIPADGVVIQGRGSSADFLRRNLGKGTILSFKVAMDEPWASAQQIVGGCNRLLVDWVIVKAVDSDCARPERDPRMPRSAVAFEGKRLWLVTVDGRQPGYSMGANSDEFSQFLFDLGARHALNLDGGGSTTFAIRREGRPLILNSPSDGRERPIANALLISLKQG